MPSVHVCAQKLWQLEVVSLPHEGFVGRIRLASPLGRAGGTGGKLRGGWVVGGRGLPGGQKDVPRHSTRPRREGRRPTRILWQGTQLLRLPASRVTPPVSQFAGATAVGRRARVGHQLRLLGPVARQPPASTRPPQRSTGLPHLLLSWVQRELGGQVCSRLVFT